MRRNECLAAALHELAIVGIRDVAQSYGSKHLQLRWRVNGTERRYSLALTPSDVRAVANTRSGIRKILREDGLIADHQKVPETTAPKLQQRVATLEGNLSTLRRELAELKEHLAPLLERNQSRNSP